MENRKSNKKKIIIGVLIVLVLLFLVYDYTPVIKVPLGYMIYGNDVCQYQLAEKQDSGYEFWNKGDGQDWIAGDAISPWKCGLCYRTELHSNTATPELCSLCAKLTNRCEECGKLNVNN